jgi:hypothetical protein
MWLSKTLEARRLHEVEFEHVLLWRRGTFETNCTCALREVAAELSVRPPRRFESMQIVCKYNLPGINKETDYF